MAVSWDSGSRHILISQLLLLVTAAVSTAGLSSAAAAAAVFNLLCITLSVVDCSRASESTKNLEAAELALLLLLLLLLSATFLAAVAAAAAANVGAAAAAALPAGLPFCSTVAVMACSCARGSAKNCCCCCCCCAPLLLPALLLLLLAAAALLVTGRSGPFAAASAAADAATAAATAPPSDPLLAAPFLFAAAAAEGVAFRTLAVMACSSWRGSAKNCTPAAAAAAAVDPRRLASLLLLPLPLPGPDIAAAAPAAFVIAACSCCIVDPALLTVAAAAAADSALAFRTFAVIASNSLTGSIHLGAPEGVLERLDVTTALSELAAACLVAAGVGLLGNLLYAAAAGTCGLFRSTFAVIASSSFIGSIHTGAPLGVLARGLLGTSTAAADACLAAATAAADGLGLPAAAAAACGCGAPLRMLADIASSSFTGSIQTGIPLGVRCRPDAAVAAAVAAAELLVAVAADLKEAAGAGEAALGVGCPRVAAAAAGWCLFLRIFAVIASSCDKGSIYIPALALPACLALLVALLLLLLLLLLLALVLAAAAAYEPFASAAVAA
jgi:hypothetical protein